jgi:hypothetical protein
VIASDHAEGVSIMINTAPSGKETSAVSKMNAWIEALMLVFFQKTFFCLGEDIRETF